MIKRATIYWIGVAVILAIVISFTGCVVPPRQAVVNERKIEQVKEIATEAVTRFVPSPAKEIANVSVSLAASIASLLVGAGAYTHSHRTRSRSGGNRSAGTVGKIL